MWGALDPSDVTALACVPGRAGINVQQIRYCRPDGTEIAFGERDSKGFVSKLSRYTGMDAGSDRRIDLRDAEGTPFLRVICKVGTAETGSSAEVELPIGTPAGRIRTGAGRFVFELADGRRIGGVGPASEELAGRPIEDATGRQIGRVQMTTRESDSSLLDLVFELQREGDLHVQEWSSPFTGVYVTLDQLPPPPIGTFVLAFPMVFALGYGRYGRWDEG